MMSPSKFGTSGIPGTAVLFGAAGLWLVYVGIRDVPFFGGLRDVLSGRNPTPPPSAPYQLGAATLVSGAVSGARAVASGKDQGIDRLVGSAAAAYPGLKGMFGHLTFYGWRSKGSVPNSDHPKGLAIDVMRPNALEASQIIRAFMGTANAHYWIWNRQTASVTTRWVPHNYTGPNPHTDHVHLSWKA